MSPTLAVCNTDSLGEQVQRAFQQAPAVMALNTMACEVMIDPAGVPGEHDVFVCGDDADAKRQVAVVVPRRAPHILSRVSRSDGASVPEDHIIVLFGALGDLARRKLLPGLFHLDRAGLMPAGYRIIGTARKGGSDDDFRRVAWDAIGEAAGEMWERFAQRLSFSAFRAGEPEPLQEAVARAEGELGGEPRRLHYLSIPPRAFGDIVAALGSSGLADRARVVLEKPFGVDLDSAASRNPAGDARWATKCPTTTSRPRPSAFSSEPLDAPAHLPGGPRHPWGQGSSRP